MEVLDVELRRRIGDHVGELPERLRVRDVSPLDVARESKRLICGD